MSLRAILTPSQIHRLNKPVISPVNNWTLLHVLFGIVWGFSKFNTTTFIMVHSLVQIYEMLEFGYFTQEPSMTTQDLLIDTMGAIIGLLISKLSMEFAIGIAVIIVARLCY